MQRGKFSVVYMDPPWFYAARLRGEGRTKFGEGAEGHYGTMTDEDLASIGPLVMDILDDRAVVLMWVTAPRMDFAIDMARSWGLTYSTKAFTWVKLAKDGSPRILPGSYSGSNTEDVLLFTYRRSTALRKLTPKNSGGKNMTQQVLWDIPPETIVHASELREHSRKPDEIRDRIKLMYPHEKRIELFCRFPDPHFSSVGNEIDGLDIRDALKLAAGGYYDLEEGAYRVGSHHLAPADLRVRLGNHRLAAQRRAHRAYRVRC